MSEPTERPPSPKPHGPVQSEEHYVIHVTRHGIPIARPRGGPVDRIVNAIGRVVGFLRRALPLR
jgi:hypothetical protein